MLAAWSQVGLGRCQIGWRHIYLLQMVVATVCALLVRIWLIPADQADCLP